MLNKRSFFHALVLSVAAVTAAAAQEPPPVPPPATPPAVPQSTSPAAQNPTPPAQPPVADQSVAPPQPAIAKRTLDEATLQRRRAQVQIVEGVLMGAVRVAAQQMAKEMQTPETGPFQLSGKLSARGFLLDEYGVFFHVEIPGVQPSLLSPIALEMLRQQQRPRQAQAQPEVASSGASALGRRSGNTDADYVELVKESLVKAMIEYSKPLELRPHEWFTVAAGDGDEPMMPGWLSQQSIMVLRVRGADIADYMAGRVSLEDVLKKVEVRKF
jgi:hypothetical protein